MGYMRQHRSFAIPATIAVAAIVSLIAGCGEQPPVRPADAEGSPAPGVTTPLSAHGLISMLPAGWQSARSSLTPNLTDPREVLAVATYPLEYRETRCSHMPGSALRDLGPSDAFVTLQERGSMTNPPTKDFAPRPTHFGPRLGGPSEAAQCVPGARFSDHWFTFGDQGRRFHALVAFGPQASATTRAQAWSILDGLSVDPQARPDWRSTSG